MYILFISDAVPMENEYKRDIYSKFGDEELVIQRGNLAVKHESVREFVKFIKSNEKCEEEKCADRNRETLKRIKGEKEDIELSTHISKIV